MSFGDIKKIPDSFGSLEEQTRVTPPQQENCWLKLTVKSKGDVNGVIQKEGDKWVMRLSYKAEASGECQCSDCEEVTDLEVPGENNPESSMLWEGSKKQNSPTCSNRPSDSPSVYNGVLKGGFTFIMCFRTDDMCKTVTTPDGNTRYWVCDGKFGPLPISKEVIIPLKHGPGAGGFCSNPVYASARIQEDLENRATHEFEAGNPLFECNSKKRDNEGDSSFLGGEDSP